MYAYIAFPIANYQQFIYKIPEHLISTIKEGVCVEASFRNKNTFGFVVSIVSKTTFKNKIKSIDKIAKDHCQLPSALWKTIIWIANYYICPIGIALKTAVPLLFKSDYVPRKNIYLAITKLGRSERLLLKKKAPKQFHFLSLLDKASIPCALAQLSQEITSASQIYKKLLAKEFISIIPEDEIISSHLANARNITLNQEQTDIFDIVIQSMKQKKYSPYLLHGITGSGKTEIYIKLAAAALQQGQTMLMLVPEISLTPQLSQKFIDTFGEKIGLWHSKLTKAEKYQTWQNINSGKCSIIIGARSAIFSPVSNLGLIIIDEEHDASYKQESSTFKYHARDVGMVRAKYSNATIVLGSATPSIESYYNAINSKFKLLEIKSRYNDADYPQVNIVDMKEGKNRFSYDFSHQLITAMKKCIQNNEQMIILHNRRGFSNICRCQDCGEITRCDHCSISLTYHSDAQLICHYCSRSYPKPQQCSNCNGSNISLIGTGTQKIELEINKLFPDINIARMDFDTMKNYSNYKNILSDFESGEYDILLGTQMVSKGLDFSGVTLVGVINGDTNLYIPDFRSGERTFQLLYQVCGRAGRNQKNSKAIIQSWNPDNVFIKSAAKLSLDNYYHMTLKERSELKYPPYAKLFRILITGINKQVVESLASNIKKQLDGQPEGIQILGPSVAPIEKIKNNWRFHLLIKADKHKLSLAYNYIAKKIGFKTFHHKVKGPKVEIEVDPISIL